MLWYVIIALHKFIYWFEFVSQFRDVAHGQLDCLLVQNKQSTQYWWAKKTLSSLWIWISEIRDQWGVGLGFKSLSRDKLYDWK